MGGWGRNTITSISLFGITQGWLGKKYNNKYLSALFVPGRALMTFMCCMSRSRGNKQLHFDFLLTSHNHVITMCSQPWLGKKYITMP